MKFMLKILKREVTEMGLREKSRKSKLGGKPTSIEAFGGLSKPRTQPVLAVALSLVLVALALSIAVSYAEAADPGHAAASISAGTFESGDYAFPNNLTITNNLTVANYLMTNGSTLYVDALNGRVGIGTTSPGAKLEILDSSSNPELRISPGASATVDPTIWLKDNHATLYGHKIWYDNDVGATYFDNKYDNNAGSIFFRTKVDGTPINALTILGSGNVGIGTTAPSNKLDVAGDINASSGSLIFYNEIMPDGASCSNNQILKKTGANDWDCADDSGLTTSYNTTYHTTSSVVAGNYSNWATTYNATYHNPVQAVIGNYSAWQTVPGNYSTIQAVIGNWSGWAATYNVTYHTISNVVIGNYSRWANQTATDVECADCIAASDMASGSVTAAGTELASDTAGDGLKLSSGALAANMTPGGGIETTSDSLSLNRSCGNTQILKWNSGSSVWYCADDSGVGSETDPLWTANQTNYYNKSDIYSNASFTATYNATYHTTSNVVIGNYSRWANQTATDVECADCVDGAELADSVTLDANLAITGYNVTFDGGTLFVDASNDRVGIGTTTPDATLAVNGSFVATPPTPVVIGTLSDAEILNDTGIGLALQGRYLYALSPSNNTLAIIDVYDPASPKLVSYYGGVSQSFIDYPSEIVVNGKYAYVTSMDNDRVAIIDVSDPSAPFAVGNVSSSTQLDYCMGLYLSGKYLYVTAYNDDRITAVDVSNPAKPVIVGSSDTDSNENNAPRSIFVQGKYAYVAHSANSTGGTNQTGIVIFDVSDPANITKVIAINSSNMNYAYDVYVSGGYAYVTGLTSDNIVVFNVTNPAAPNEVGSLYDATYLNGARGIVVAGRYAYIASPAGDGFAIVNVSDPASPTLLKGITSGTQLDAAIGVLVSGRYAYVGASNDDMVTVVDLGYEIPSLSTGSVSTGILNVESDAAISNTLYVGGGASFGKSIMAGEGISSYLSESSATAGTTYGASFLLNDSGAVSTGTDTGYGVFSNATRIGATGGTIKTYSGYFNVLDDGGGTSTAIGVYASASGADSNYAAIFENGNVGIGTTTPSNKLDVAGDINASSGSLIFYNEIMPDGASCSNNQILKKTGANDWDCADDSGLTTSYNTTYHTTSSVVAGNYSNWATTYNASYMTNTFNTTYDTASAVVAGNYSNWATTYNATYHTTSNVVAGNYSVLEAAKGNYTTWQAVVGNWSNWATTYNATYHNPVQAVIGNYSAWATVPGNYSTIQAVIGNWSGWALTYNATYHNPVQAMIGNYSALQTVPGNYSTIQAVIGNWSRWANQTATDVQCTDCVDGVDLADSIALDANLAITGYNVTFDTSTLHVDANNDRVGIGTATPSKKLDVSDGTKAITFDPAASTPTINTTASYNLTITSSGGNVIIQLG